MNFWNELKKPIFCLAPMADVTDAAFRYIIAKNSNIPHVTYTEFVSADGLVLAPEKGKKKLLKDLEYSEIEKPIVAQIFGSNPENIERAAKMIAELNFDGLDINMGCPDKSIEKQGAGAALIKNPQLAREIIKAAKRGVKNKIPISVKTRLGYNQDQLEEWLPKLLAAEPAAIIIHARTRKEMSKMPAKWERIKRAVEIKDNFITTTENKSLLPKVLIIGNGDIRNLEDAKKKCEETGADGAMFGRSIFGNPWLFAGYKPNTKERLEVLLEHVHLFNEKLGQVKSFALMKKHFKEYLSIETLEKEEYHKNLRDLKYKLMKTKDAIEAIKIIKNYSRVYF